MPFALTLMDIEELNCLDILNSVTKVDRNFLPRFMQAIEAHMFYHGYAYRKGSDEYLILLPSLFRLLSVLFLDELRRKLAELSYPDIEEITTISIGLCVVGSVCPLTDRELLARANGANLFAINQGKNQIAAYRGPRFIDQELEIVSST